MTQVAAVKRRRRKINHREEKPVLLSEFGKLLDPPITYWTVRDYWETGRESESGKVVRLETMLTPTGRATTLEAYHRFIDQLNDG